MTFSLYRHDEATGQCVWRARIVRRWRGKRIVTHRWSVGYAIFVKPQRRIWFSAVGNPLDWSAPVYAHTDSGWFDARPNQWR